MFVSKFYNKTPTEHKQYQLLEKLKAISSELKLLTELLCLSLGSENLLGLIIALLQALVYQ